MAKKTKPTAALEPAATPRLLEHYLTTVRTHLAKALDRTNPHAIPRLEKIIISMGVGVATTEKKHLDEAIGAMAQIAGQKPIATLSKVAVAGFKLRENLPIGCKVTLRGRRMYEFFDRLVAVALDSGHVASDAVAHFTDEGLLVHLDVASLPAEARAMPADAALASAPI